LCGWNFAITGFSIEYGDAMHVSPSMKKLAIIFAVLTVLVFVPTGADAKDKHKKHHSDRNCHNDYRRDRYSHSYRSYDTPRYYAPRYYSPYRSYGYSRDCDRRSYSYRPSSGFWISFR